MRNILSKNKGASMLLAICIFMFLAVLGFNVLAAASSNTNNTGVRLDNEKAMQYVNSIYEIVDGMICDGEFVIDGYLDTTPSPAGVKIEVGQVKTTSDLKDKNGNDIVVDVKFFKYGRDTLNGFSEGTAEGKIEAQVTVIYEGRSYSILTLYEKDSANSTENKVYYKPYRCGGVISSEHNGI